MRKVLDYAKKRYSVIRKNRSHDVYYAVVRSLKGGLYESVPITDNISSVCAERGAIAQMKTIEGEDAKIDVLVLLGAVGRGGLLTPCGLCRQTILNNNPNAIIVCAGETFTKKQHPDFSKPRTYLISDLLPHPWHPGNWD